MAHGACIVLMDVHYMYIKIKLQNVIEYPAKYVRLYSFAVCK